MSLDKAAKHLAAHGRGSDTELVHMSKGEIAGLQELAKAHGGSLTINPHTGLAEAGFLEQVLPMVAIAGATMVNPALGAAVAGGITTAQTGSLEKGILAGALAYGGGELLSGLGSTGTPAPVTDLSTGWTPPVTEAATAATPAATSAAPAAAAPTQTGLSYTPGPGYGTAQTGLPSAQQLADTQAFTGVNAANQPTVTSSGVKDWWNNLSTGKQVALGGMGVLGLASLGQTGNKGLPGDVPVANTIRLSPDFQGYVPRQPKPYYQADYTQYAAAGGLMDENYAPGGIIGQDERNQFYPQGQQVQTQFATPSQMPTSAEVVASDYEPKTNSYTGNAMRMATGGDPAKKKKASLTSAAKMAAQDPYEASLSGLGNAMYHSQMPAEVAKGLKPTMNLGQLDLAEGGHLGGYSDGGRLLKGPGDGVSDSIPAQIGKRQPARLADGEFVVPARIVSELGNGSTDAGARKLYEMMDKVQASRRKSIGKGKFAVNSKASKHLPK